MNIIRVPDQVMIEGEEGLVGYCEAKGETWTFNDVAVTTSPGQGRLTVDVEAPKTALRRVRLRWHLDVPIDAHFLGDAWERGYGEFEWRGMVPERVMPWYFLLSDSSGTHGFGVKTGPAAMCFWQADSAGVSLWLDLRNGDTGVMLGERVLRAAEVVCREGRGDESAFVAAREFCKMLCDSPRIPTHAVYGSNNWYYAYGRITQESCLDDARLICDHSPGGDNPPYMVIDAGWQADSSPERPVGHGPWDRGNKGFPDIPGIADAIRDIGARPGIWVRPLGANPDEEDAVLLPAEHGHNASGRDKLLDPSIPEVLERISGIFSTLRGWGYEMIKHDFSTCDIFGLWGVTMKSALTMGGWHFADRSRTTAEIILDLYRAIRTGAGTALLIGCNTLSHLGAGLFDLQRTGDDTSGQAWERTRKLGVNTLAFRMAQHGTFYMADADCVGLTKKVPWDLNKQWLDLLAESGTPLFVSADPDAMGPEQSKALKRALALNAEPREPGEPLDWMDSVCPRQWKLSGKVRDFSWYGPDGVPPM